MAAIRLIKIFVPFSVAEFIHQANMHNNTLTPFDLNGTETSLL